MSKSTTASEPNIAPTLVTGPKTFTNWDAFSKAGLYPMTIKCQGYSGTGQRDFSCHTPLPKLDSEHIKSHINAQHGGSFEIYFKKVEGKVSPLWADLRSSGLEAADCRCDACDKLIRFHPTAILEHMRSHPSKTRHAYREITQHKNGCVGKVCVTFGVQRSEDMLEDEDESGS